MKNIVKNTFILILSLLLISCTNFFNLINESQANTEEEGESLESGFTLSGSFSYRSSGAIPSSLSVNQRSALPDVQLSDYYFTITALNSAEETIEGSVDQDEGTYSIVLSEDGEYTLTLEAYSSLSGDEYSGLVLTGQTTLTVASAVVTEGSSTIELSPITSSTDGGNVELIINVDADSGITSAQASWTEDSVEKSQDFTFSTSQTSATFTMLDSDYETTKVPCGQYPVAFTFSDSSGNIVYSFVESINVFDNLTTNSWISSNNNTYLSDGEINITSELVSASTRTSFYVSSSGDDDSGTGTAFKPYATLQKAIDIIESINDGSTTYSIILASDITGPSSNDTLSADSTNSGYALGVIEPSTDLNIVIQSSASATSAYTIDCSASSALPRRAFFIGSAASVTIKNLIIKNGYGSGTTTGISSSGGAILSCGSLILEDTQFSNNTSETRGGAIEIAYGSLTVESGCVFSSNTAAYNGGSISVYPFLGNASLVIKGGEFEGNTGANNTDVSILDYSSYTGSLSLSGSAIFDNPIYLCSSKTISLGILSNTAANQSFKLVLADYTAGTQILAAESTSVPLSVYCDRFSIMTSDGSEVDSQYNINTTGYLAEAESSANTTYSVDTTALSSLGACPSEAGYYSISTEEELVLFSTYSQSYNFSGSTIVLLDNIELTEDFSPIGLGTIFQGTFDGNGNKITGLNISSDSDYTALIAKSKGDVKNLYVSGSVTGCEYTAGIVAYMPANTGSISNCVSDVEVNSTSGTSVGGICGSCKSTIYDCINLGNVTGTAGCVGGIAGAAYNVYSSANFGVISGSTYVGGLVGGLASTTLVLENAYNIGSVTSSTESNAGGIVGFNTSGSTITNCYYDSSTDPFPGDSSSYNYSATDLAEVTDLAATLTSNNESITSVTLNGWSYTCSIDSTTYPIPVTFSGITK